MPQLVLQGDQEVHGVHAPFLRKHKERRQFQLLETLIERWKTPQEHKKTVTWMTQVDQTAMAIRVIILPKCWEISFYYL